MKIGKIDFKNNVIFAPMAGFSDVGFRNLMYKAGVAYSVTEMISAKGLCFNSSKTKDLLIVEDKEETTAVQLFGDDPQIIAYAIKSDTLKQFSIIDINMGCPVLKIVRNNEGSALLKNIDKAYSIAASAVKASGDRPVTIKMRKGYHKGEDVTKEFVLAFESAGVAAVAIHGRTREDFYSGQSDWDCIKRAKEIAKIPIIANGGVFSIDDYNRILSHTNADGVMVARGALGNPDFVAAICKNKNWDMTKKEAIFYHIDILKKYFPDKLIHNRIKKAICYYFKGDSNSAKLRKLITESNNLAEIITIVDKNCE